jgi:acetylornithine deacetylase/succinyl-diaminopimelate desuccinylase-like protein
MGEYEASLNLGRITGGISVNSIASHASADIDLRCQDAERLTQLADSIAEICDGKERPGVELRLDAIGHRPGGGISQDHPLIQFARKAAEEAGLDEPVLASGSTDASLPLSKGLPSICVGLTRGGNAHTADEFIEIGPITAGYDSLLRLIRALAEE